MPTVLPPNIILLVIWLLPQPCIFLLKPIPQRPSKNFTGLYATWKPHILRQQLLGCPQNPSPPTLYNHYFILLLPFSRQKLKQEVPALKTIQRWSDKSESMVQDCFDHTDWDMLQVASENNINSVTISVYSSIRKCIGDVVPSGTIKTYPNQKPWIDGSITFNHGKVTGNMVEFK
jgi:hypothetical protein